MRASNTNFQVLYINIKRANLIRSINKNNNNNNNNTLILKDDLVFERVEGVLRKLSSLADKSALLTLVKSKTWK